MSLGIFAEAESLYLGSINLVRKPRPPQPNVWATLKRSVKTLFFTHKRKGTAWWVFYPLLSISYQNARYVPTNRLTTR